jgi:hypothetical protein
MNGHLQSDDSGSRGKRHRASAGCIFTSRKQEENDRLLREAMRLLPIVAKNGTGEYLDPALVGPDPRHHRYHAEPFAGKGGP